jgi:hypothetical protein
MRGSQIVRTFLVIVSSFPCGTPFQLQRTTGVVRSADGPALGNVWVQELGEWNGSLSKADDGLFRFTSGRPSRLLFTKEGFRSQIRVTTGFERPEELSVLLALESDSRRVLPSCKNQKEQESSTSLRELKLKRTHDIQLKKGGDVDFVGYAATYTIDGIVASLASMTGIHVAGLSPNPDWTKGITEFTVSNFTCGGYQWIDLRGTSEDGLQSRWVGYALSYVEYSKVPSEAARAFDDAIDSGCCVVRR